MGHVNFFRVSQTHEYASRSFLVIFRNITSLVTIVHDDTMIFRSFSAADQANCVSTWKIVLQLEKIKVEKILEAHLTKATREIGITWKTLHVRTNGDGRSGKILQTLTHLSSPTETSCRDILDEDKSIIRPSWAATMSLCFPLVSSITTSSPVDVPAIISVETPFILISLDSSSGIIFTKDS